MNYKTCKRLNEHFALDEGFNVFLAVRDALSNQVIKRVPVMNPLEKGYIYACMYFFDEVDREVEKLRKMIAKMLEEVNMEVHIPEPAKKLMELSARVRNAIGDDSLDVLIKEILAKEGKAIALLPDQAEMIKFDKVLESIFIELYENFSLVTLRNTQDVAGFKQFKFTEQYVNSMTERQRKLVSPAIRMVGFENSIKMNELHVMPDWTVRYKPERLPEPFTEKAEQIKMSLKKMKEEHLL